MSDMVRDILPVKLRTIISEKCHEIYEIRMRYGKEVLIIGKSGEIGTGIVVDDSLLRETIEYISSYSLYAYTDRLREGFITVRGGHRVGVTGRVVTEEGRIKTISDIASLNIRISHEIKGCSDIVMPYLCGSILIISAPRMGKTTILRDIIRNISNKPGEAVAVIDERSEIASCYKGIPQNDLGKRSDVLDCCPKEEGMNIALRALAPTYIGVDELSTERDVHCVKCIKGAGVNLIGTVHGQNTEDITNRREIGKLVSEGLFERYIEIEKVQGIRKIRVYNQRLTEIFEFEQLM